MRPLLALLLPVALAACGGGGALNRAAGGVYAPGPAGLAPEAGLEAGHRLMAAGEAELALRAYMRAAIETGLSAETLASMGSANLALGRLGQAEDLLRRALDADGSFVPAWNNLGVVLMEKGEHGEAALSFRRAFALDSGASDTIRDNLATALAKLEDPDYTGVQEGAEEVRLIGYGEESPRPPEVPILVEPL
jgi:tetratricopeptide (TPR) repeat protein